MPKINFYSIRQFFKGDPKKLSDLRDAQHLKLKQFKESGSFVFTMEADDAEPALVISWKGDAGEKDYWKTLVKAKESIKGTFVANAKAKSYTFTTDEGSKVLLGKYLKLKDAALSIAFWNLVGFEANIININDTALQRRTMKDITWELATWPLAREFTTDDAFFDGPAPLRHAEQVKQGKTTWYRLPNGLGIPGNLELTVTVEGKMVKEAFDEKTGNQKNADILRDNVKESIRAMLYKLCEDLNKIDEQIGKTPKTKDKQKLVDQANKVLGETLDKAEKAILASAQEQWLKLLEARVDYRDFQIETTIEITKGTITFVLGAVAAGVGGITGVGAVLGLVGLIKGGLETLSTCYTAFRDMEGQGKEINIVLASALEKKSSAGWKDFGKTILGSLPGGVVVQQALSRGGVPVKAVKDIKKDVKAYNGKASGLVQEADKLRKQVAGLLKASNDSIAALETKEVKELEDKDPDLKKRNKALRKKIGENTTEFLENVANLYKRFTDGKAKVDEYEKLIELLEKEIDKEVFATVLRDVFTPLLNLPWGMDPENLAGTIISAGSVTIDVVTPLISELTKDAEGSEEVTGWLKTANDLAGGINGIVSAAKGK